jgi:small subunit ribosomal protein S19
MAKKEFSYRGKTADEIQRMSLKELASILPARARRKIKRGFTEEEKILLRNLKASSKPVKTHCRTAIILPEMVGKTVKIHNGKAFEEVTIQPDMLGQYLGEFSQTRKKVTHSDPGIGATKSSAHTSEKK